MLELSLRKDGPSEGKGVEDRTLDFLLGEEEGWKGLHCENGRPTTLLIYKCAIRADVAEEGVEMLRSGDLFS